MLKLLIAEAAAETILDEQDPSSAEQATDPLPENASANEVVDDQDAASSQEQSDPTEPAESVVEDSVTTGMLFFRVISSFSLLPQDCSTFNGPTSPSALGVKITSDRANGDCPPRLLMLLTHRFLVTCARFS